MDMPADLNAQYSEQMVIDNPSWQTREEFLTGINEKLQAERNEALWAIYEKFKKSKKYEELKDVISFEYYNWIVVAYSDWKPKSFYKYNKENGIEFYMSLKELVRSESYDFWLKCSWYEDIDWKIFRNWEEIKSFLDNWKINPLFIKAVDDIIFYTDVENVFWLLKTLWEWWKLKKFESEATYQSIISWVSRIKEIVYFRWKWYISDEDLPRLLKRAIQELPRQCADMRFYEKWDWERIWMEVTKAELDEYLHPKKWDPLITQKTYDDCVKIIEKRDKFIQEREAKKVDTKAEIWKEMSANLVARFQKKCRDVLSNLA